MWIVLDNGPAPGGPERVLPQVEALAEFQAELGRRLDGAELGGVGGTLALAQRLRAVLAEVSAEDVARARATVRALEAWLAEAARRLEVLRRMKEEA